MKKKILRYSLITVLAIVAVLVWFSFSYKAQVSAIDSYIARNPANSFLKSLPEGSKDSSTLLHRLLNTVKPESSSWNDLLIEGGSQEKIRLLSEELEQFAFPLT